MTREDGSVASMAGACDPPYDTEIAVCLRESPTSEGVMCHLQPVCRT